MANKPAKPAKPEGPEWEKVVVVTWVTSFRGVEATVTQEESTVSEGKLVWVARLYEEDSAQDSPPLLEKGEIKSLGDAQTWVETEINRLREQK